MHTGTFIISHFFPGKPHSSWGKVNNYMIHSVLSLGALVYVVTLPWKSPRV